jgi:hypothetical protein
MGSNPFGAMFIFFNLARCWLYGGNGNMGMDCVRGGGNRKGEWEHGNGLCAERRESERQNTEWAEREMADYYYSFNK